LVWEKGEVSAMRPLVDAEFEHRVEADDFFGLGGVYRGLEGFASYRELMRETTEWDRFELDEIREAGSGEPEIGFVTLGRVRIRARYTGIELDRPWAYVYVFRRGRLLRTESYSDRRRALEAVGL
jgi:ketosteroid isomerase-like protein